MYINNAGLGRYVQGSWKRLLLTWPTKDAMHAPVCTRGPSLPSANPPPTDPMLPKIWMFGENTFTKIDNKR